ncbi:MULTISPECIES: NYN domain-containing protein [unclassified Thermosynechococcus]|uniref:NYN domain-containing protein n=1 Tax=unclassified Thermosynechococcus TaxID=2622553 RepID=UPI0019E0E9F3|nr:MULTISPECIES: NYN domain-containing protein [unclassified Thermosynechococcus]HIK36332.1 NYN domain-containing protein [Thermosynechococcus sp. M98_K2018_005]HIK48298.1 NYN domain-containing protein [Thermosynechococcus sp. M55_K2018_012]
MKPELWFIAPVSAIALGGIATLIQPQQPLATLLGSGIGALAGAPLIEKNQRRSDRLLRDIHTFLCSSPETTELKALLLRELEQQRRQLADFEQQLHQALPEALGPMRKEIAQTLETLKDNLRDADTATAQQLEPLIEAIHAQSTALQTIQTLLQRPQSPASALKTAVLYDIENLVFNQGQRLDPARVNELVSLDKILESIQDTIDLGEIAIKRAYGNWQNQILQALNAQLERSQIERVGVYGRNRDQRNAADIQLALDAIALIYEYPDINTFVLISGDGGFGSIALRLRDYGKTVIGCAYRNAASDSFQRVCHQFIFLENPFIHSAPATNGRNGTPPPRQPNPANTTSRASPSLSSYLPVEPLNYAQIPVATIPQRETEKLLELLAYYTSDPTKRQELAKGIIFDTVFLDMKSVLPQLEPLRFGFFKPSEWVAYLTEQHQLPICVAVNSRLRKAILCWRDKLPEDCRVRTHEPQSIHTVSIYRAIFAHEVAGDSLLTDVGRWLMAHRPRNMASREITNAIYEQIRKQEQLISKPGINRAIANYVKAGILTRTLHPSGDTLTLNPAIKDFATLVIELQTRFRQAVEERLSKIGETINEQVFAQAVPLKPLQLPTQSPEKASESQA